MHTTLALCFLVSQDKSNKVKDVEPEDEVEQQPNEEEAQQAAVQAVQRLTESHGPAAELPSKPILGVGDDLSGAAFVTKVSSQLGSVCVLLYANASYGC